jgi:hypothetical protein
MRGRAYFLENYLAQLEVKELLTEPYSGEAFCGYAQIDHDFGLLEAVFTKEKSDWKSALSSLKGIYVIFDKSNGMKYVGSAYGDSGIWSRWSSYLGTGHGWNDELMSLIERNGIAYARGNFKFALLEIMSMTTPDDVVIRRECYWKSVLLSREYGYNKN